MPIQVVMDMEHVHRWLHTWRRFTIETHCAESGFLCIDPVQTLDFEIMQLLQWCWRALWTHSFFTVCDETHTSGKSLQSMKLFRKTKIKKRALQTVIPSCRCRKPFRDPTSSLKADTFASACVLQGGLNVKRTCHSAFGEKRKQAFLDCGSHLFVVVRYSKSSRYSRKLVGSRTRIRKHIGIYQTSKARIFSTL